MNITRISLQFSPPCVPNPSEVLIPADLSALPLGDQPVELHVSENLPSGAWSLRFTIAANHKGRSNVIAEDWLGKELGRCHVWEGAQFQPFDVKLSEVPQGGIRLRSEGAVVWVIAAGDDWALAALHLWTVGDGGNREKAALDLLAAPHCQQPFGWKDGCITDALAALHQATGQAVFREALLRRVRRYLPDGHLHYDYEGRPLLDRFITIESGLPAAALLDLPGAEALPEILLRSWREEFSSPDGTISDGATISTEGCYTVAWPLARIADGRRDETLAGQALHQLRVRRERLRTGESFWQVRDGEEPGRLAGWARGIAWHLLGHVRTVSTLKEWTDIPCDISAEIRRASGWAMSLQRDDGLWSNFLEEADVTADASGSAGIAAALALGARAGLLDDSARAAACRAYIGLGACLEEDGWLSGCAQENKGGEVLQRSSFRVRAPFGLGLWGQLHAALLGSGDGSIG